MGQQQSKDDLLYQYVNAGDSEAVKVLCREGANLECFNKEGKTPLIVACMNPVLFDVSKTLIEMGANVNAYRPGRHAGTPLHHAAKRGLEQTVKSLLSHGANALVRNDDCHTPLDVARIKGHTNVVREIESHVCYFSGWLREFHGPGFLKALAPQLLSRKIWVVVMSCGSDNSMKPPRCELAIYPTFLDAQPRALISLWNAKIEEPIFHQSDPALIIFDQSTKTRYKLASSNEGDKQQLQWLYNACRGIPQVMPPQALHGAQTSIGVTSHTAEERPPLRPSTNQSFEAINANGWGSSADVDIHNGWGTTIRPTHSEASSSGWMDKPAKEDYNGWDVPHSKPIGNQSESIAPSPVQSSSKINVLDSLAPSAPPIPEEILGEDVIHYPSIDISPVNLSVPATEYGVSSTSDAKDGADSSSCVICWETPIQAACVPCGHMPACMSCLNEIKAKKGVCPVCRAKVDKVLRVYAV